MSFVYFVSVVAILTAWFKYVEEPDLRRVALENATKRIVRVCHVGSYA